ncbi:MAG: hypothetical protein RL033_1099 [Pseudomonadota bacterium]
MTRDTPTIPSPPWRMPPPSVEGSSDEPLPQLSVTPGLAQDDVRGLLAVISAQASLAIDALPGQHPVQSELRRILEASERATALLAPELPGAVEQALPLPGDTQQPVLETLTRPHGRVALGWAAPGILFASFHGRLSDEMGEAYALRLAQLLDGRRGVQYFLDASDLESFELLGRTVAMRALVTSGGSLASVLVLNWAGGESPTARDLLRKMAAVLRVTQSRAVFDAALFGLAPTARALIGQ